jgi:hypothetical protein
VNRLKNRVEHLKMVRVKICRIIKCINLRIRITLRIKYLKNLRKKLKL